MKAIRIRRYGGPEVLAFEDAPTPAVGDRDVLVRVHAASVNAADWHLMRGWPRIARLQLGVRRPRWQLGQDCAGVVEAVGAAVTAVGPGDEVVGTALGLGSFAEQVAAPVETWAPKPADLTWVHAAALPLAGVTALQALRDVARVEAGQRVLVHGASGGVGTFAVQIAKAYGAEVTGACSTAKVDLVRSLGADEVIDRTAVDPTREGGLYDVVLDLGGTVTPSAWRRVLAPRGVLVASSGDGGRWVAPFGRMLGVLALRPFVTQDMTYLDIHPTADDLRVLGEMAVDGRIDPVVDREVSLAEVPDAIRHLEAGAARGKVVVVV